MWSLRFRISTHQCFLPSETDAEYLSSPQKTCCYFPLVMKIPILKNSLSIFTAQITKLCARPTRQQAHPEKTSSLHDQQEDYTSDIHMYIYPILIQWEIHKQSLA